MAYPQIIYGNEFLKKVIPHINASRESIDILVFYWTFSINDLNDPVTRLISALQAAMGRGVVVRVLVNNDRVGDSLVALGFRVRHCYTSKLMHPKVMIIDSMKAVLGSHNYTTSGLTQNMEVSCVIPIERNNSDLQTWFNNLWGI